MNISKAEFVSQLAKRYGYTKKNAAVIVDDVLDNILFNIGEGNTISFYGFGCFDYLKVQDRTVPNPQTGEDCYIKEHYIPRFYPGLRMKTVAKIWNDNLERGIVDG